MKDRVVVTENMKKFMEIVNNLGKKSKKLDRMGLVYGKWGLGKTTSLEWYYSSNTCFYVRSLAAWSRSVNMMIEDVLGCYRVESRGRLKEDIRELIQVAKKHQSPLFIDEADRLFRKSILIETIRDIHDLSRIPIILIGQEDIIDLLQRRDLGHIYSRITEVVEYKPLTAQDIIVVCKELCGLDCDSEVALKIRTITLGDFRLLNTLLAKIERACSLNKVSEITMSIVKKVSKSPPGQDGFDGNTRNKEPFGSTADKPLRAID